MAVMEFLFAPADAALRGRPDPFVIEIQSYPGGEPFVTRPVLPPRAILLRPRLDHLMHDFMGAMFFVDALKEREAGPVDLLLPFVPGARQDRRNDEGDYLFTAKSIAKEINLRGFDQVVVFDPHSDVAPGLIERSMTMHVDEFISHATAERWAGSYDAIVSPDAGAEKRAGRVAKLLGKRLLHGWKTRDVKTGAINGFGLEPCQPHQRVLVVDDICDGGATFLGLASVLAERGLTADLYVTHGLFTKGTEMLREAYGAIFTTDSVEGTPRGGVTELPVCRHLAANWSALCAGGS